MLFRAAQIHMILGLVSGLYYREITKAHDFSGDSQLGVVHTHLLALGMLFFLLVLALERSFALTESRLFRWFFWIYNAGLVVTVVVMTVRGTMTVLDRPGSEAIAGIAGLGHILLTAGLVLFFLNLGKRITVQQPADTTTM
jgi:hypothetical protein